MSNLNDFGEEVVPMRGTAVAPFARALQSTRRWAQDCRVTQIHETTSTVDNTRDLFTWLKILRFYFYSVASREEQRARDEFEVGF